MRYSKPLLLLISLVLLPSCVFSGTSGNSSASGSSKGSQAPSPTPTPTVTPTPTPVVAVLTSITVTPANPTVTLGKTQQFIAIGSYSDGTTQNISSLVVWTCTNGTGRATINSSGLLTTVGGQQGSVTVSATAAEVTISGGTAANVGPPALSSIAVTPGSPSVPLGLTQQFTATGTYTDGSTQSITGSTTWSKTNGTGSASINSSGLVTTSGGSQGTVTITANLNGVSGNTVMTVAPPALTSIAVTPATPSVPLGLTQQFAATGTYTDASTQTITGSVTWSKTNGTGAVSISSAGLVTTMGGSQGTVTITASLSEISGSTVLTVAPPALVSIAVTPSNPSVAFGNTQQFTATGTYTDNSTQNITGNVTWSETNGTGVAAISTSGLVTTSSGSLGTVTITASQNGINGNTTLTITPAVTLLNLHNKEVVETGFVVGTATSVVSQVGCQFDGGTIQTATGTTNWSCPLPNGSNTWHLGSAHTITVGTFSGGTLSQTTTINVTKGNNHDINGDGYPDLVVSAPYITNTNNGVGAVNIYYGSSNGVSTTPTTTLTAPSSNNGNFGYSIALGDINGNGYADIVIGDSSEAVYIYNGSAEGVPASPTTTLTGPSGGEQFGYAVALGDLDGDGYADIVVSDPAYNLPGPTLVGAVYIYNGASDGVSTTPTTTLTGPTVLHNETEFGLSVAVDDLNGDGYADLVVGDWVYNTVYIYNGSSSGVATTATTVLTGPSSSEEFGYSIALGDIQGNGYADLVVGAPGYGLNESGYTTGAVYIYNGASGGLSTTPTTTLIGPSSGDGTSFGSSVALGDTTGDGNADVVVGAPDYGDTGAVYIYSGSSSGVSTTTTTTLTPPSLLEQFGASVALSDIQGNGYSSLLVGAPGYKSDTGAAYIYNGSSNGISTTAASTLTAPNGGSFGMCVQ